MKSYHEEFQFTKKPLDWKFDERVFCTLKGDSPVFLTLRAHQQLERGLSGVLGLWKFAFGDLNKRYRS